MGFYRCYHRLMFGLLLAGFLALSACKGAGSANNQLPSLPTPDEPAPDPDPPADPPSESDPQEGKFKVVMGEGLASGLSHFIHHEDGFDEPCEVDAADADKDIECMVEATELDLAFHGLEYTYSATSDFCTYVFHAPYFYADRAYGTGPVLVQTEINAGVKTGISNATADGEPLCTFDYTTDDGPNCCTGSYTYQETNNDDVTQSITETREWGGKIGNCLDGAGVLTQAKTVDQGIPLSDLKFLGIGPGNSLKETYKATTSPEVKDYTIPFANYYDAADHASGHPVGLDIDSDGTVEDDVNPDYLLLCTDQSFEVQARIKIKVREWNELSELNEGATGDHDTTGADPDDPSGGDLNDFQDWEDFGDNFPEKITL